MTVGGSVPILDDSLHAGVGVDDSLKSVATGFANRTRRVLRFSVSRLPLRF